MEIVIRAAVLFLFLWVITRVVGRSTVGEPSTFQLALYVVMGDLVQQGVTQQDYSVTSAVLAVGVFALLTLVLAWANARFPRVRGVTHGCRSSSSATGYRTRTGCARNGCRSMT